MISQEEVKAFQQHGAICLRDVFEQKWLDKLAVGIEKNRKDPGPYACQYTPENKAGDFYDDYCNWNRFE